LRRRAGSRTRRPDPLHFRARPTDRASDRSLQSQSRMAAFLLIVRSSRLRWLSFFVGGLIIASPLPDELGIGLLGVARLRTAWFVLLSYAFNFLGILAIGGLAGLAT